MSLGPSFRFQKVLTNRRRYPGKEKNNGSFTLWDHGMQRWIGVSLSNMGKSKMSPCEHTAPMSLS